MRALGIVRFVGFALDDKEAKTGFL